MNRIRVLFTLAIALAGCGVQAPEPVFRLAPAVAKATPAVDLAPRLALIPTADPTATPTPTPTATPTPVPTPASHPRFALLRTTLGRGIVTVVDATTGELADIGSPPAWGGPGLPHVSADGRWLVYMGLTRLILWDCDTQASIKPGALTDLDQREPDVDATGRTLIYFTGPSYAPELATCDVTTGNERRLSLPKDLLAGARSPTVSADGRRAAYVYTSKHGDANLAVLDLATGRPITPATLNSQDDDQDPALSPDGQYLLFATDRNGSQDVYACDLDTGACREPAGVNTVSDETRPRFLGADAGTLAWVSVRQGVERAFAHPLSTQLSD